jgi:hypothetical protein
MRVNMNINPSMMGQPFGSPYGGAAGGPFAMMQQMMMIMMTFMSGMMAGHGNSTMMPGSASFGGSGGGGMGGSAGVNNFLGGGGGGAATAASGAPATDIGSIQGGTEFGRKLAADAGKNANGPGGYCYKWVAQALGRHGVSVSGASAYMGADQLARNPKFREVKINPSEFKKLPPGAVVVWNKGPGKPHGHISIALGDGREASDKIRNQITNYGTSARVFIPK